MLIQLKMVSSVALLTTLCGCAQTWFKASAQSGEFEQDRYACIQTSQQGYSEASISRYSLGAVSTQITNPTLFASCMNAKGWTLQNKEATDMQVQQIRAKNERLKEEGGQIRVTMLAMCAKPELKAYYENTACEATAISFQHIANKSKITEEQQAVLIQQREEVSKLESEVDAALMRQGPQGAKVIDLQKRTSRIANEQNNLDLYNGKITWGEYNQKRKNIYLELTAAIKKIR